MAKVFIPLIELPKRGDDAGEAPSMSVERHEILDRERPCGQSTIRHPESARDTGPQQCAKPWRRSRSRATDWGARHGARNA